MIPIYAIRFLAIQELRCVQGNTLTFEGIVERLTTFELSNFDNYRLENLEFTFKANMILKKSKKVQSNKKSRKGKDVPSDNNRDEEDVKQLVSAMLFSIDPGLEA